MKLTIFSMLLLAMGAGGAWAGEYWAFDGDWQAQGPAALVGKPGVFEKGTPPVFDADVPAACIWDGATFLPASATNRSSLRFVNEGTRGAGSPNGGEVIIEGAETKVRPASFTIECFVKMKRQMARHALLASKRRNGQTGASWSLSIDPAGVVRARFDTQPGADSKSGEGFNQTFASAGNLADGAWHHVALTFEGATRAAAIYVDYTRSGGGVTKGPLVYDEGVLLFGRGLDGWLDEVRLSAEVLHPEQFLRPCKFFSDLKPRVATTAMLDQTATRVQTELKLDWAKLGTLRPKSVAEIKSSMWSLGCETLDRDLADWDAYKEYLQPLGIRHIRLQGGWNKTEKAKGVYDFAWLDRIVDDAQSRGLEICLETDYGNRLYEPTAGLGPGGRLPEGEETLAAWDKWVEAMVRHYAPRGVKEWMMFNEPNLNKANTIEKTTDFNLRTAEIIKRVDPEARIGGMVISRASVDLVKAFVTRLQAQGKLDLFTWIIYHHYSGNPDATYDKVEPMAALLREQAPKLRLWQGEAGCASEEVQFALSGVDWTELSQAKWNLRRMLGDVGRGIRCSVFTISDLSYHKDFISRYGLLKTGANNAIIKVKTAYYAVQNAVSVINDAVEIDNSATAQCDPRLTCHLFRDKATGLSVVALWDGSAIPANDCVAGKAQLTLTNAHFKQPVWLDLITGNTYAMPTNCLTVNGAVSVFKDLPYYDAPAVITDKSLLSIEPARIKKKGTNPMAQGTN